MLSVILAISRNSVIGRNNDLPWHLSADLKRFKAITTGHTIIMGRRTWESIGRPLPNRRSIVVSRQPEFSLDRAEVAGSLAEAVAMVDVGQPCFVIGGAGLFHEAIAAADKLYVTHVEADIQGDVTLDPIDFSQWHLVDESHHAADDRNDYPVRFCTYHRQAVTGL